MKRHPVFPATARQRGLVAPSKFAHVVYLTSNFEALTGWYKLVFEAEVVFRNADIAFLTYDEEHHRIAIIRAPEAGVHHVAYGFDSLAELLGTYERLEAFNILPFWAVNHGPTTSLYYRDPDGNPMEFQVDNFDSTAEAAAYFLTEDFVRNPIGVEFEPDELLRRWRAGEPDALLKTRPQGPASPIR